MDRRQQTAVIGLNSVKLNKDTIIASYTLVADSIYCDYDPIKKKADIGTNFLEREFERKPRCWATTPSISLEQLPPRRIDLGRPVRPQNLAQRRRRSRRRTR